MRDVVVHRSGLEIDLQAPTLSDERLLAEIREAGRDRGVLRCLRHGGDLYLQVRKGTTYACHWPGTAGSLSPHPIALMSVEHRTQVAYIARSAEREGFSAVAEKSLPGVRPDLVVNGDTAFEVQRSHLSVAHAKGRTTKAVRAGMSLSLWISDKPADRSPAWLWRVPSIRVYAPDWKRLPTSGVATVESGLSQFVHERCYGGHDGRCIRDGSGRCTSWRLRREPLIGVTLDRLSVGLVTKEYVPLEVAGDTHIVMSALAERIGTGWTVPSSSRTSPGEEGLRRECVSASPTRLRATPTCVYDDCFEQARLYPGGLFCVGHAPGGDRTQNRRRPTSWAPSWATWTQQTLPFGGA